MIQQQFATKAIEVLKKNKEVLGVAAGGSWITGELDEFSDVDLVIVTKNKNTQNPENMKAIANSIPNYISGFTGEHVGEPRLLICLYRNPILHVDFKFVTLEEFGDRIETPVLLHDPEGMLQKRLDETTGVFPYPDYQWIEDRFWIWVHYTLLKIGRGELMEAFDFFGFLRMVVIGSMIQIKNGNLPKGVRKVETNLSSVDYEKLKQTLPQYDRDNLLDTLLRTVTLYKELRQELFTDKVQLQTATEEAVMEYYYRQVSK
ncbi:oxalate:formate antiporter [Neptunitalea chrysea]|uniref:Oxalate:formate antiporter n=1 Tax=Neptunitalea chrysea TaxID=1647581 RepID=A0A9W6EV57_9FLAO|nr:nucleotidyltransferase domain-containing protein [Neptunitalea chrysea]GLB52521.1 oxalate:formate antiporter [Neptunitalea chrysea]